MNNKTQTWTASLILVGLYDTHAMRYGVSLDDNRIKKYKLCADGSYNNKPWIAPAGWTKGLLK